jgi:hypothetical protein
MKGILVLAVGVAAAFMGLGVLLIVDLILSFNPILGI